MFAILCAVGVVGALISLVLLIIFYSKEKSIVLPMILVLIFLLLIGGSVFLDFRSINGSAPDSGPVQAKDPDESQNGQSGGDEQHDDQTGPDESKDDNSSQDQIPTDVEEPQETDNTDPIKEPDNSQEEDTEIPQEYKNALVKAAVYSDMMHMSKQAIYDQLVSEYGENFPADAAQYAIDNLQANYKENALKKAKVYYEDMNMSKEAVRNQLTSEYGEKFTEEEANYAIDNLD